MSDGGRRISFALSARATGGVRAGTARILVCDDDDLAREAIEERLSRYGYRVTLVASGAEAIAAAMKEPPDVILLDMLMPDLSGYGTMVRLEADERTRAIPVIILSAFEPEGPDDLRGAAGWVRKGADDEQLFATLKRVLAARPEGVR